MDKYNSSKYLEQVRQSVMYKLLTCKINNTITGTRDDFRQTVDENLYQMLKRCGKTESMDFIANLLKDEAILLKECFPHQSTKTMSKSIKPQDIKEIKDSKNKGFNIH